MKKKYVLYSIFIIIYIFVIVFPVKKEHQKRANTKGMVVLTSQNHDNASFCDKKISNKTEVRFVKQNYRAKFENSDYENKKNRCEIDGFYASFVFVQRKHRPQLPRMSLEEGNSGRKRFWN